MLKTKGHDMRKGNLLSKVKKQGRGTNYEIYTDGTLIIKTKMTSIGINIPKMAERYFDFSKIEKMKSQSIPTTWKTEWENSLTNCVQVKSKISKYNNSYYIQQTVNEDCKKIKSGTRVTCIIQSIGKQFYTAYFQRLASLRDERLLEPIENLNPLLSGGEKNTRFTIYENNKGNLFIKSKISKNGSRILLSDELTRYITNWHKKEAEYFVCSVNESLTMVVKAKSRPGNREGRYFKELFFYSHDITEEATIIFTTKHLKLSSQALQDLALTKELQAANFHVKQITANWLPKSNHKDEAFTRNVRLILKQAFEQKEGKILFEPKITCDSSQEQTKCVDGLLFWQELLGLVEIKTSKNLRNNNLDEILGELLYIQDQLQTERIFSLVFINTEVTTTEQAENITKLYGLGKRVILIGKKELQIYSREPTKLIKRITDFFVFKNKLNQTQLIHPLTHQLTTKEEVEQEAYKLLLQTIQNPAQTKQLIKQYCFLMNLTVSDYYLLHKEISEQSNNELIFDLNLQSRMNSLQPIDNETEVLKKLHFNLSIKGNYSILEVKYRMNPELDDYKILLDHWDSIIKTLPATCSIYQFKLLQSESGLAFENDIREFLEGKGYKVVSNILFSFYGKHFEVDHLIFKDGNMYIVSCKDRSSFQYLPNLYSKIRFAIGEIDFRRKTINCDKSQIYVKVKKGFLSKLKNVFQEYQTDKLSLMVTD